MGSTLVPTLEPRKYLSSYFARRGGCTDSYESAIKKMPNALLLADWNHQILCITRLINELCAESTIINLYAIGIDILKTVGLVHAIGCGGSYQ